MKLPLDVIIASAVRSPVGRAVKGTLRTTRPDDLAACVLRAALDRVPQVSAEEVEDVVLGCAMPEAEQGLNVARSAVLLARLPNSVPGETVNRFCSSGLQAIVHAGLSVQAGLTAVALAGGVESMSMVPMSGNKVSINPKLMDHFPEAYIAMGQTAERVAARFHVTREEQDTFAVVSHARALAALAQGKFDEELVPVPARTFEDGKEAEHSFSTDECPRLGTSLDALGRLKPAFKQGGTVTAGNSSPLSDGAAASLIMSRRRAEQLGIQPLGVLRGYAVAGVDPDIMGTGPVPAIRKLLAQAGLSLDDIELFEINEAFAAQVLYCQRELNIPTERLNVNGGAIALGHPLGCTGAKLTATLLHELKRRGNRFGVVAMCIGGGMGAAGLFENPAA